MLLICVEACDLSSTCFFKGTPHQADILAGVPLKALWDVKLFPLTFFFIDLTKNRQMICFL